MWKTWPKVKVALSRSNRIATHQLSALPNLLWWMMRMLIFTSSSTRKLSSMPLRLMVMTHRAMIDSGRCQVMTSHLETSLTKIWATKTNLALWWSSQPTCSTECIQERMTFDTNIHGQAKLISSTTTGTTHSPSRCALKDNSLLRGRTAQPITRRTWWTSDTPGSRPTKRCTPIT